MNQNDYIFANLHFKTIKMDLLGGGDPNVFSFCFKHLFFIYSKCFVFVKRTSFETI